MLPLVLGDVERIEVARCHTQSEFPRLRMFALVHSDGDIVWIPR